MLAVNIKSVAGELAPGLVSGEYETTEGSTVQSLLEQSASKCGAAINPNNYKFMLLLFDGKPIQLTDKITKSGTLHLCRIVVGG